MARPVILSAAKRAVIFCVPNTIGLVAALKKEAGAAPEMSRIEPFSKVIMPVPPRICASLKKNTPPVFTVTGPSMTIGGWPRTAEPVHPYTTAETMDAGWCWQIEHEHFINRGYVFSSAFLEDDAARAELLRKNPKIAATGHEPRIVRFRSGRYARNWVGNVVAIGNANGFVEPLEATAISTLIYAMQVLTEALREGHRTGPAPTLRETCNRLVADIWTETRDFLAMHYRFNTRLDTPFWQHTRAATPLRTVEALVAFYEENGPSMLGRHTLGNHDNIFGLDGHLMMLLGNRVPHRAPHTPTEKELAIWKKHSADYAAQAAAGIALPHALACIRHPAWRWG